MFNKSRIAMLTVATASILGLGATAASACTTAPGTAAGGYGQGQSVGLGNGVGGHGFNNPGNESSQGISTNGTGLINVNPVICGDSVELPISAAVTGAGLIAVPVLSPATSGPATAGSSSCQTGANS
jgi:hypothetical protein